MNLEPFVSVVTPVYNGEKYLAECIESVLAQSYKNWEYIICNNCSTDRTLEIAQYYAQQDSRIRVHNNEKFLSAIQNWNHTMRQISVASKYCKVVHADDWLFPECLTQMVRVAEENSTVGIVGAYRIEGVKVRNHGLPYPSPVVPGREVCRLSLLGGPYVFGSPTSLLIRSDLVRSRDFFYNEANPHPDEEACYEVLLHSDFGFIHQILSYSRMHEETMTTSLGVRYNTYILGRIIVLEKYGSYYLNEVEYKQRFKALMDEYYAFLGNSFLKRKEKKFWDYHQKTLENLGYSLNTTRLLKEVVLQLLDIFFNPKQSFEKIIKKTTTRKGLNIVLPR